jgi:hypothetical protein
MWIDENKDSKIKEGISSIMEKTSMQLWGIFGQIFISRWFAFLLTLSIFSNSPFFLYINGETFFYFYLITIVLSIFIFFTINPIIWFLRKRMK